MEVYPKLFNINQESSKIENCSKDLTSKRTSKDLDAQDSSKSEKDLISELNDILTSSNVFPEYSKKNLSVFSSCYYFSRRPEINPIIFDAGFKALEECLSTSDDSNSDSDVFLYNIDK
jgi:hypothetical protein